MSVVQPSHLVSFLHEIGASPNKKLSQNFLIDGNIVKKIVDVAQIQPGEFVLEIGPGPGALTEELIRRGAIVFAVEKDPIFAEQLARFGSNVKVFKEDFMEFSIQDSLPEGARIKIVANLPYHLTSPILGKICEQSSFFSSAFLMVQKEVAERMVAEKGTRQMSLLTLFLQIYSDPSFAIKFISRKCYLPAPNVDSSVVKLEFQQPKVEDSKNFMGWIRGAFQQRRKMLRSTLSIKEEPFATLRPEDLSLDEWIYLFNAESLKDL